MEKRKSKNGRHRNIEMRRRAKKSEVSILLFVYFSPSQLEEERIFKNRDDQNKFLYGTKTRAENS